MGFPELSKRYPQNIFGSGILNKLEVPMVYFKGALFLALLGSKKLKDKNGLSKKTHKHVQPLLVMGVIDTIPEALTMYWT